MLIGLTENIQSLGFYLLAEVKLVAEVVNVVLGGVRHELQ